MPGRNLRDLVAACLWAGGTVAAVALSDSVILRTALGAPMVFLVAGHALLRAIGVRTSSVPEHLVFAVGASIAADIVGGFVLHVAGSLTPLGWAVWLWAVISAAALAAALRRESPGLPSWRGVPAFRIRPHGATVALAVLIVWGAYGLAVSEQGNRQFTYTEFWMVPAAVGDPGKLVIGVRSAEPQPQRFDVEVTLGDTPLAVFRSLVLAPGETWTREIAVPVTAKRQKAEARLLRLEDNRLYRRVSALVPSR